MRDISHFEIAPCNAYKDVIEFRWGGSEHWLLDDNSPIRKPVVRRSSRDSIDVNRVSRKTIDVTVSGPPYGFSTGDLISNLTPGFWVHLTDRSREEVIWRASLYTAWQKGTRRTELQDRLDGIRRVRNHIAHNEWLFDPRRAQLSPKHANTNAGELLSQLCPEAAAYVQEPSGDTIEDFLTRNPAPVKVRL